MSNQAITTVNFTMPAGPEPSILADFDTKIIVKIFKNVFPIMRTVIPFFNCGTSLLYIRGYGLNDEHMAKLDNLDLSFLLCSQACYEFGTNLLYGTNYFRIENCEWSNWDDESTNNLRCRPDVAKWWFKKIGDHNIHKIKRMTLLMESGWVADRRDHTIVPSPFEMSYEEHWLGALFYLFHRDIKLNRFKIILYEWEDLSLDHEYRDEDKMELNKYRKLIIDLLAKFRGQKKVDLVQQDCAWLSRQEAANLQLLMIQRGGNLIPPPPPQISFAALLELCRREWEERQQAEAAGQRE